MKHLRFLTILTGIFAHVEASPVAAVQGSKCNVNGCVGGKATEPNPTPIGGVDALKADIAEIQVQLANANNSLVPFKGGTIRGLIGLLVINEGVVVLGDAIDQTTATARNTPTLNGEQSTQVGFQFLGAQPQINTLVVNLQQKKPEFDKTGFKILCVRGLIRDNLVLQQAEATDLGDALTNALDPGLRPIATQVAVQAAVDMTPDDKLERLGEDENDLRGVPFVVLAILRRFDVI